MKGVIAMNQMSFKNVFCKILLNDKQREKMTSLKDVNSAYELFCKNGYSKSLDEFKVEMNNFLSSADGQKIMSNDFDELSDEMLEMVAGGRANKKRIATMLASGAMALSMIAGSMVSVGAVKHGYGVSNQEEIKTIGEIDHNVRLSIGTIEEIMEKVAEIKGHEEATKGLLSKLDKIKSLLQSTAGLELFDQKAVETMVLYLKVEVIPTIVQMNKYFSEYSNDPEHLLDCLESDCDDKLKVGVEELVQRIKFSDEISKNYRELNKAKRLIEQISNPKEKQRLKELCEKTETSLYKKIYKAVLSSKPKRKDELVGLANSAISEIKKALDAQKKEENKIKDERKDREKKEERKPEELAAKKQKEELANRKLELKQQEIRLKSELDKLDKQAEELGNFKEIYDGWYTGDQLPVIRRLFEINYKLEEVRDELDDMNVFKMLTNMKSGSNRQKEKELVRKKFEINREYVNLSNELENIKYFKSLNINLDSKEIESKMKNAEKEMTKLNKQIKDEIENRNKIHNEIFKFEK